MFNHAKLKLFVTIACMVFFVVLGFTSFRSTQAQQISNNSSEANQSGPLDGMIFSAALGPDGKPKSVKDVFVFENGTFL